MAGDDAGDSSTTKLALVCSSGGHLYQLHSLKAFWGEKDHFWVSFKSPDAEYLLDGERVYWAYSPTNRNVWNLLRNFYLTVKLFRKERPSVVISTGAGVGVPFIVVARLTGVKSIYLESVTRNEELSLSARLVLPFVDKLLVQWPELAERYDKAEYHGRVI